MNTIVLADKDGCALFTVPGEDWAAIDQRAEAAIGLSGIAKQVTQYLPGFEALVQACQAWHTRTRPVIGTAAHSVVRYSDVAIAQFQQVRDAVSGPLTPQVQQQVIDALAALSQHTTPLNEQFHQVSSQVADFADVNRAVDAQVNRYVSALGQEWRSVLPQTDRVDNAAGRVRGVWQALSADLNALVSERIEVTDQFIASLEIDVALAGWADLRAEALSYLSTRSDRMPA